MRSAQQHPEARAPAGTRPIKLALTQIAEQDPELARLLGEKIKTGKVSIVGARIATASAAQITGHAENATSIGKELEPTARR